MTTNNSQSIKGDNNSQIINNFANNIDNISSILANLMQPIAEMVDSFDETTNDTSVYKIEDKISYNKLRTFKEIVEQYGQYGLKIDGLYEEYDNNKPGTKKAIFKYFQTKYFLKKEEYHSKEPDKEAILVVQENSDKIIREIYEAFLIDIKKTKNLNIIMEHIETCALAVTCHAFIQCKILEKPNNDYR